MGSLTEITVTSYLNGRDGVSNHQSHHCLFNCLFIERRSKETLKLRVTGLCAGNSPVTGEFSAQMANNAEDVSIWWRHHARRITTNPQYGVLSNVLICVTWSILSLWLHMSAVSSQNPATCLFVQQVSHSTAEKQQGSALLVLREGHLPMTDGFP